MARTDIRVVCLGKDRRLLETRRALLASRYETLVLGSAQELAALDPSFCPDLLVLCHTLSERESEEASELAHRKWPRIKILTMTTHFRGSRPGDAIVVSSEGPAHLLSRVQELMRQNHSGAQA